MSDQSFNRARATDDAVCLGNGYDLAEFVTPSGDRSIWLWSHDEGGTSCTGAPVHERVGPLPPGAQAAVDAAFNADRPLGDGRCEATSVSTGCRCRGTAKRGSRYCGVHARRLGTVQ